MKNPRHSLNSLITPPAFLTHGVTLPGSSHQTHKPQKKKRLTRYKPIRHLSRGRVFVGISLGILLATTIYWATLSARIEQLNSDQLVDTYLFENLATFKGALFPGAHTMLLKWPLFWLMAMFGATPNVFLVSTVILCIITIGLLVALLSRIEKRPYVFGMLCLALASVLLLVPTQSHPGALLPVNMAMTTTRNIEYALYAWCIYWVVRAQRWRSGQLIASGIGLTLLIASDKLFAAIGIGGGLLAFIVYSVLKKHHYARTALRWTGVCIGALLAANALLALLNVTGITHIVDDSATSPYLLTLDMKQIGLGLIYLGAAVLTNFGANPAADIVLVKILPSAFLDRIHELSGPAYIVNLLIAGVLVMGTSIIIWHTVTQTRKKPHKKTISPQWEMTASILFFSFIAACGAFIFTDHYYAADARYLTIVLFGGFAGGALYISQARISRTALMFGGVALLAAIPIGIASATLNFTQDMAAYSERDQRNRMISRTIAQRDTKVVVGDYWLSLPLKTYKASSTINALPLESCVTPRQGLSSQAWQVDLYKVPFAYLASKDDGKETYNGCPLDHILNTYGMPNETVTISGNPKQPDEMLLFYDRGIQTVKGYVDTMAARNVLPYPLASIAPSECPNGTVMNIVAHQDDDLLFMNPDTHRALQAGKCVRIVFLTAGDAGADQSYWYARENGAKNAYAAMQRKENIWYQQDAELKDRYISVASLKDMPQLSLVFMRLPDGNLHGEGFAARRHESLSQLDSGTIPFISTVDGRSVYHKQGIIDTLSALLNLYDPTEVHIQSPTDPGTAIHDHSDHLQTGRLARAAFDNYQGRDKSTLTEYLGYAVREMPQNIDQGPELAAKLEGFWAYATHDGAVCSSEEACHASVYGKYLVRQYRTPNI